MMPSVRGWARTLMWAVILLACAGVGAFIASRSEPVPARRARPGLARREREPEPVGARRSSVGRSRCPAGPRTPTAWAGPARATGALRGRDPSSRSRVASRAGVARLQPGAKCDFPSAQVQARRVVVAIVGRRDGGRARPPVPGRGSEAGRVAGPRRLPEDADHAPVLDPGASGRRSEQAEADRGSRGRDLRVRHDDPASDA